MRMQTLIEQKLTDGFRPEALQVINESGSHNVPPGSESHFKLVIASLAFAGLGRIQRHRRVYELLADELKAGVHALAIHAYTPDEWLARAEAAPASPACRGGSRHEH